MEKDIREAVRMLGNASRGYFNIWELAGPARRLTRRAIMEALTGEVTPAAKAGVFAIEKAFYAIAFPDGNCPAARDDSFRKWCREYMAATEPPVTPISVPADVMDRLSRDLAELAE